MLLKTKVFSTTVLILGSLVLFGELLFWHPENSLRYTVYLVAARVAARLQVTLSP